MKLIFHYIVIGMLYVTPAFCQQQKAPETSKPFVLGSIEEFESKILGEKRILNIYLPEGYIPNDTTRYPVVYLLDGSADEDFIHTVGLFQFNTFSLSLQQLNQKRKTFRQQGILINSFPFLKKN